MRYFSVVLLILLLALPVFAQDDAETLTMPEDLVGVIVQSAAGGMFEAAEDDMYMLTLEGLAPAAAAYSMAEGEAVSGFFTNADLKDYWNFYAEQEGVEEVLTGQGILEIAEYRLTLTLSMPEYDGEANAVTYMASVDEIVWTGDPEQEPNKLEVPETFDTAVLFIDLTAEFAAGLQAGFDELGRRPIGGYNCIPGVSCR